MKKRHKQLIILIIFSVLLVRSIININDLLKIKKQEFISNGDQLTRQAASMLDLWIDDQIRLVKQIAINEEVIQLCISPSDEKKQKLANDYLDNLHNSYPYYENLPIAIKTDISIPVDVNEKSIFVGNGEFIVDTVGKDTIGKGGINYSFIKNIFDGKSYYISEIYKSIWRGNPIFVISAPIYFEKEIVGVAIISPQIDYFTKLFVDSIELGDTGYMFLIDSSGATIAHKNRDLVLKDTAIGKKTKYIAEQIEAGNHFFEANLLENEKYYYGQKVPIDSNYIEKDLYLVVTQNKSEYLKNMYNFIIISILSLLITSGTLYFAFMLFNKMHSQSLIEDYLIEANLNLEQEVKKRTLQLEDLANRDSLTKLYNHRYINDYLMNLIENSSDLTNIAVAIIDVDNFKKVNDCYGHQVGDNVLIKMSKIFISELPPNCKVGRYGGEEFLLILSGLDYDESIKLLEKIRLRVYNTHFSEIKHALSISIGLAKWTDEKSYDLIKRADQLMYKAKEAGKNLLFFDKVNS